MPSYLKDILKELEEKSDGRGLVFSNNGKPAILNLIQEKFGIGIEEAVLRFYKSETYKTLQNTDNALWAESAEYIMDRYLEEESKS